MNPQRELAAILRPLPTCYRTEHPLLNVKHLYAYGYASGPRGEVCRLAIAANMVGKLIAMQDQRTMTSEIALQTVIENLTAGNEEATAELQNSKGSA